MDFKLSSQSSGISLADISVSNISDSELDEEDTVLGSAQSYNVAKALPPPEMCKRSGNSSGGDVAIADNEHQYESVVPVASRSSDRNLVYRDDPIHKPLMPLDDVKFTLQENHELLSDHALLKDLLHSIDKKLALTSENIRSSNSGVLKEPSMSYGPPNKDPGPGLSLMSVPALRKPLVQVNQQVEGSRDFVNGLSNGESHNLPMDMKILGKRVTFDKGEADHNSNDALTSATGSHVLLEQLSALRWRLNGWEREGLDPPADENGALVFCHRLLQLLQVTQEKKKHLEEKLQISERKLKKSSEEAAVLNRLNEKREARLHEVDSQIAVIQREWINAHTANRSETLRLQNDLNVTKKEKESLVEDLSALEKDLRRYKEMTKDYQKIRSTLEELQGQFSASRRQAAEIAEENSRLSRKLEEKQKQLQEAEEVKLVSLRHGLEEAISKFSSLEKSHQKIMRTNSHLTDDLRLLHDQHKALLQKVVDEEELKEAALKEKEALEEQMKNLTSKMSSTKLELHNHYQSQVKELVNQKTETLQEQLVSLESSLKDNLAEQLDAQREAHRHALAKIQDGHSKEVQDLCNVHSGRIAQLQQQIQQLQQENHGLKAQHQSIVNAVSSALAPQLQTQNTQALSQILEFPNMASTSTPINTRPVSPQTEKLTKGRGTSRNGSRPASGKSGHSNNRVPCLGRIGSSSSDSDASLFQDGKQTVRHLDGGAQLGTNKKLEGFARNGSPVRVRALANDPPRMDYGEYEYRSLPDLPNRLDKMERDASISSRKLISGKDTTSSRKSGSFSGREMSRPTFRKIYRASEILQNDVEAIDFPSLLPVDFEMDKLIEELKSVRSSAKTSDSEVPTHDTSFDQEPANITLRKLSQVSTLLSQYVNDAPSSH